MTQEQLEEGQIVLCTVDKIIGTTVFVNLDNYNEQGTVTTSEIAPGRIRNLRAYVVPGKKIVCKVLRVKEKHIHLSLRRVNESQRRIKLDELKKQQFAEKIIEQIAKKNKKDFNKLLSEISEKILKKYDTIFEAFEQIVEEKLDLSKILDKKLADEITEIVKQRISKPEVKIGGVITLITYSPQGIELIKNALKFLSK